DPKQVPGIAVLGPDALDLGPEDLAGLLAGNTGRIKSVITDQKVIAGIGNAYSDEILHVAKISPFATAGKLYDEQLTALHDAMISVMTDAVSRSVGQGAAVPDRRQGAGRPAHVAAAEIIALERRLAVLRTAILAQQLDVGRSVDMLP